MTNKAWKLRFRHDHWPASRVWGIHLTYRALPGRDTSFRLYLGAHDWAISLRRSKTRHPTKPNKPSLGQSILCVVGICGLQALCWWMDTAPLDDLLMALVVLLGGLAVWVAYRIMRRQ